MFVNHVSGHGGPHEDDTLDEQVLLTMENKPNQHQNATSTTTMVNLEQTYTTDKNSSSSQVTLVWRDLSIDLSRDLILSVAAMSKLIKSPKKRIIKTQSGSVSSGELIAIIGPSGAGKSTLLKTLAGRNAYGIAGDIYVQCDQRCQRKHQSMAFLDQRDSLLNRLTVRECLVFASRIKHGTWSTKRSQHEEVADKIIKQFNLTNCLDVLCVKCSGTVFGNGRKFIAIALLLSTFLND